LRTVLPGVNLDDPKFDAHGIDQIIDGSRHAKAGGKDPSKEAKADAPHDDDARLQTMVDSTGSLDLDDQGHWDYHGNSSGFIFMRNLRAQLGDIFVPDPRIPLKSRAISSLIESPKSASSSSYDFNSASTVDLPDKDTVLRLCRNTLEVACALMRFIHKPSFYDKVTRIFDTDPDNHANADVKFLPLLYVVMAVGCLFAQTEKDSTLDSQGYESAIEQGWDSIYIHRHQSANANFATRFQYFQTARNMLDITDCRDLTALQAIVFMIMFLQSTAKLATCYSYIGIALRACCRLGLHRNIKNDFSPIEQEERKRIFWLIRKMDAYVGAMLGLPQMLAGDEVDQELPAGVDDEYITSEGILPMPAGHFPLVHATNAHTKLVFILQKVVKNIYPIKGFENARPGEPYSIRHSRIREVEKDLQVWMDNLPMELRPSDDAPPEVAR
jgi:Fungal specific transcription factor domain